MTLPPTEPPDVRLYQLEGFYHVCRHGSFAGAVRALPYSITEPALHQQVRKLERKLGRQLLVRQAGRRMLPTPEGRRLFDFVAPYFRDLPSLLGDISGARSAVVVMAAEPLYVETIGAPALKSFRVARPGMTVRLLERDGDDAGRAVAAGEIDLALSSELTAYPVGVVFRELGKMGLSLLVPREHAWSTKRRIDAASLRGRSFVLYEAGTTGRRYTDTALTALELTVDAAVEASSALGMRALVRAGVAPAFVPSLRTDKRWRRRTTRDGIVEFDVTGLADGLVALPCFGLLEPVAGLAGDAVHDLAATIHQLAARG